MENLTLQQASAFFYDQFGRKLMEDNSEFPKGVEPLDAAICSFCGRYGHGVYDGRPNTQLHACMQCWSLFHPAPSYFPGSGGKDMSMLGKIKSPWLLTADRGMEIFVSRVYLEGDPNEKKASLPKERLGVSAMRYIPLDERTPLQTAMSEGAQLPFLSGHFVGQNKAVMLEGLEMSLTRNHLAFGDRKIAGARMFIDADRIDTALAALRTMPQDVRFSESLKRWFFGYEMGMVDAEAKELLQARRALRALGLPETVRVMPLKERLALKEMAEKEGMTFEPPSAKRSRAQAHGSD